MKTKTQEQLEKEIKYIENFPEEKDQTLGDFECKGCGVELNISERDKGDYCMNCLKAKLSQHLTDIKNFEKLIGDLKYNSNGLLEYKKRIKEALKNL